MPRKKGYQKGFQLHYDYQVSPFSGEHAQSGHTNNVLRLEVGVQIFVNNELFTTITAIL